MDLVMGYSGGSRWGQVEEERVGFNTEVFKSKADTLLTVKN